MWDYAKSATVLDPSGIKVGLLDTAGCAPAEDLGTWQLSEDQLRYTAALEMQLPVANVDAKHQRSVLVRDIRRFTTVAVEGDEKIECGVSVRLVITVWGLDVSGQLTLPIVAAKAQLGILNASVRMGVVGFTDGALFELFPNFSELTVDSYGKYAESLDSIRKYIADHPDGIRPSELRRVSQPTSDDAKLWEAVGTVRGLLAVADGRSLEEALNGVDEYKTLSDSVRVAYERLNVEMTPNARPDRAAAKRAALFGDYIGRW